MHSRKTNQFAKLTFLKNEKPDYKKILFGIGIFQ